MEKGLGVEVKTVSLNFGQKEKIWKKLLTDKKRKIKSAHRLAIKQGWTENEFDAYYNLVKYVGIYDDDRFSL